MLRQAALYVRGGPAQCRAAVGRRSVWRRGRVRRGGGDGGGGSRRSVAVVARRLSGATRRWRAIARRVWHAKILRVHRRHHCGRHRHRGRATRLSARRTAGPTGPTGATGTAATQRVGVVGAGRWQAASAGQRQTAATTGARRGRQSARRRQHADWWQHKAAGLRRQIRHRRRHWRRQFRHAGRRRRVLGHRCIDAGQADSWCGGGGATALRRARRPAHRRARHRVGRRPLLSGHLRSGAARSRGARQRRRLIAHANRSGQAVARLAVGRTRKHLVLVARIDSGVFVEWRWVVAGSRGGRRRWRRIVKRGWRRVVRRRKLVLVVRRRLVRLWRRSGRRGSSRNRHRKSTSGLADAVGGRRMLLRLELGLVLGEVGQRLILIASGFAERRRTIAHTLIVLVVVYWRWQRERCAWWWWQCAARWRWQAAVKRRRRQIAAELWRRRRDV